MGFAGSQGTDLAQAGVHPLDSWYSEVENLGYSEPTANIPWLLSISVARGNAATAAIAKNCVVFCEPEWGCDITGGGKSRAGGHTQAGGPSGGLTVAW